MPSSSRRCHRRRSHRHHHRPRCRLVVVAVIASPSSSLTSSPLLPPPSSSPSSSRGCHRRRHRRRHVAVAFVVVVVVAAAVIVVNAHRLQRSEPVHKIIHDVSGVSSLTCSSSTTARPILLPLLLLFQRWTHLYGHEQRTARLKPGGNAAERLALAALLLVLPHAEESLAPGGVRGKRRAAV